MSKIQVTAPEFDNWVENGQQYPTVYNTSTIDIMKSIFETLCVLEEQGEDELRSIWFYLERGGIEKFGDYEEFLEIGEVNNREEFERYWLDYYPEKEKWYSFSVAKYKDGIYFYVNSKLTLECNTTNTKEEQDFVSHFAFVSSIKEITEAIIAQISNDIGAYNSYVERNLPHKKRVGRILRKDFWDIFPEEVNDFRASMTPDVIKTLEKIRQTDKKSLNYLKQITAGDFFRFCEMGYNANNYFSGKDISMSPKEKYIAMADGRDCGLTKINEDSFLDFETWFDKESNCGGHPWEICRGGNSTHISLYVSKNENGWYLWLAGSSAARVEETIKIAIALYSQNIPFLLRDAEEILKMAKGSDFIGIVPEGIIPRYCHSFFPKEDNIIDFMNLWDEKQEEIIKKAFWYPITPVELK